MKPLRDKDPEYYDAVIRDAVRRGRVRPVQFQAGDVVIDPSSPRRIPLIEVFNDQNELLFKARGVSLFRDPTASVTPVIHRGCNSITFEEIYDMAYWYQADVDSTLTLRVVSNRSSTGSYELERCAPVRITQTLNNQSINRIKFMYGRAMPYAIGNE